MYNFNYFGIDKFIADPGNLLRNFEGLPLKDKHCGHILTDNLR